MATQKLHGLTDLPADVVQLVARFLLPYDIIALSRTCKTLKPVLFERSVWLQIAESVSQSRPLPYTAAQAKDLPIKELILPCLRAQRISKDWAEPIIYSRNRPVKICFPDKRIVTYFTFLPGSRHLMVYDAHNVMSCWTTDGQLLQSWRVARSAKLTRWKPCDESENNYDYDHRMQAVEIMIEFPRRSVPTRCEIILLIYLGDYAKFEPAGSFRVPSIYEPFSAMTQDELRGSLVGIPTLGPEHVGIYLTDRNTEKAICIDTTLNLVVDCVPQALLSSLHMVLYWETLESAYTVAYDMSVLRTVLGLYGCGQDDPALARPVIVPPSDKRVVPFVTVLAADPYEYREECEKTQPSLVLSENSDVYPVIIPKWTTLREDLRRHRTRSVLTFSRRPPPGPVIMQTNFANQEEFVAAIQAAIAQQPGFEGQGETGVLGLDVGDAAPGVVPAPGLAAANLAPPHNNNDQAPRTTITHHYFDYTGSGSGPAILTRAVIAEATLRRPINPHMPRPNAITDNFEEDDHGEDIEGEAEAEGFGMDGVGIEEIGGSDEFGDVEPIDDNDPDEEDEADLVALGHGMALGLHLGDVHGAHVHLGVLEVEPLDAEAMQVMQVLEDFGQDPLGGGPVMGYGGRCAMWVEERSDGQEHVLRVATFPTYEPPPDRFADARGEVHMHPELEKAKGNVGTLDLPGYVPLERAYSFDLDDVRGVVGIATFFGDVWLVDYS